MSTTTKRLPPSPVSLNLFALAARYDWEIKQGDVDTAFLSSDMNCDLWAAIPNWFDVDPSEFERENMSEDEVLLRLKKLTGYTIRKVQKGMPGIPQGPTCSTRKRAPSSPSLS